MSLAAWDSFRQFKNLNDEINLLLRRLFSGDWPSERCLTTSEFVPRVDLHEDEAKLKVEAETSCIDIKSLDIFVNVEPRPGSSCYRAYRRTMTHDLRRRSPAEVFDDHLRLAGEHRFEEDIDRNVSPDIIILERRGIFRGREGAMQLARLLEQELPNAPYAYTNRLIEGRVAFLEWTSEAEHARVRDGADSFLIENGWIVAQTIHYTVEPK